MSFDLANTLDIPQLPSYLELVERGLGKALASSNLSFSEPLSRLIKNPGKRLRPTLVIAIAASQGQVINEKIISASVAVELIHIASLVHDDIIDNASTRRGIPTINSQEGLARAILVGDYVLAKAYQQAATINVAIAEVIGSAFAELCDGQALELMDQYNLGRSQASYIQAIHGKTAALMSAACRIGGLCTGLPQSQIKALSDFGEAFGMAFQLIDDSLDLISSSRLTGKAVGNDLTEGVYTLPLIVGLAGVNHKKLQASLVEAANNYQPSLVGTLMEDGSIAKTILLAKTYNQSAYKALERLPSGRAVIAGLKKLPDTYLNWALKNLVVRKHQTSVNKILETFT